MGARAENPSLRASETQLFRGPAGVVRSDFAFRDLPIVNSAARSEATLLADDGLPPAYGRRVRSVAHAAEADLRLEIFEDAQGVQWEVTRLGRFWINSSGAEIRYCLRPGANHEDIESLLIGPVLATAAQLRGEPMLHASAVTIDGGVVAFAGPQGRGKSTISAALATNGYPHFSDDVLHLRTDDTHFDAERYLPTIRLWGTTIEALGAGDPSNLERVVSWADKRRLPTEAGHDETRRWQPLRAVYLLAGAEGPGVDPCVRALDDLDTCLRLQAAMYGAHWMPPTRAARSLPVASALATSGLVRELSYERDFDSLDALRATILDDLCVPG